MLYLDRHVTVIVIFIQGEGQKIQWPKRMLIIPNWYVTVIVIFNKGPGQKIQDPTRGESNRALRPRKGL